MVSLGMSTLSNQSYSHFITIVKEPEWLFPCQAWEPGTRFWLYVMGTGIQVSSHGVCTPHIYSNFACSVQVSVFVMFIWRARLAWRPGAGTPGTRLSKTLWI